jgi:hypothetical protein
LFRVSGSITAICQSPRIFLSTTPPAENSRTVFFCADFESGRLVLGKRVDPALELSFIFADDASGGKQSTGHSFECRRLVVFYRVTVLRDGFDGPAPMR